jgi:hypothetical protein
LDADAKQDEFVSYDDVPDSNGDHEDIVACDQEIESVNLSHGITFGIFTFGIISIIMIGIISIIIAGAYFHKNFFFFFFIRKTSSGSEKKNFILKNLPGDCNTIGSNIIPGKKLNKRVFYYSVELFCLILLDYQFEKCIRRFFFSSFFSEWNFFLSSCVNCYNNMLLIIRYENHTITYMHTLVN